MNIWWTILAGVTMGGVSLLGVLLTLITMPGVWLMLAVAALMQWVFPAHPFSWWTIGVCAGLALAGEIFEVVASGFGAKKAGGGRSGSIGSVVGARLGALVAERGVAGKTWTHSAKIGGGAAAGRLAASLVKAALTAAIGVVLTVAAVLA